MPWGHRRFRGGRLQRHPVLGGRDAIEAERPVGPDGRTQRIDLLIETAGRVWIIDYKTGGGDPAKDRAQVRRYLDLARPLYPGRSVTGLLTYLDRDTLEEIP